VRPFAVAVGLLLVTLLGAARAGDELLPDLPYQGEISDPVVHTVDFSVIVTPPYHCHVLKVWLPVPTSDAAQEVSGSRFSTFPLEVEPQIDNEPIYGNRFAYFEFHDPQGAQIIRHQFQAKVSDICWGVDAAKVTKVAKWPDGFKPYLAPQAIDDSEDFQQVLSEIVPRPTNAASDLASVMRWIDGNLKYDHVNASLSADANHAFTQRGGHRSDYHGLCATMGRALGYPTRMTYGMALSPKNSPSHCKVEAYLPPYGWVSFDISETQKMIGAIGKDAKLSQAEKDALNAAARARLLSGYRENSWLLLTRGSDYDLAPQAAKKVRIVRTAYVEADGVALPDPDPANKEKREFAWMTAHSYKADKKFKDPFKDFATLEEWK
jgi:transglutaminase-like putative cysteine protease